MSQTGDCLGADIQGKTKIKKKNSTCLKIIKTGGKKGNVPFPLNIN